MGYNRTKKSIERVRPFLDQLVVGTTNLEWASNNPTKLAYYIREGVKASTAFAISEGEPYLSYSQLAAKYILRTTDTRVIADLRTVLPDVVVKAAHSNMNIMGVTNVLEAIGAAIKHGASKMSFPDMNAEDISEEDLIKLFNWCQANGYYIVLGDVLSLTKDDPGVAWTPSK